LKTKGKKPTERKSDIKYWHPTNEKVVMGSEENGDEWILIRKTFSYGVRYLLQEKRTDASKPYYLTQRIYMSRVRAEDALWHVATYGALDDT
jgi:hypothetical protein